MGLEMCYPFHFKNIHVFISEYSDIFTSEFFLPLESIFHFFTPNLVDSRRRIRTVERIKVDAFILF